MAQQTNIIEESYDRLQEAFESMSEEIDSFQKRVAKQRRSIQRDARKRVVQLRRDLRRNDLVKRAEKFQTAAQRMASEDTVSLSGFRNTAGGGSR